LDETIDIT